MRAGRWTMTDALASVVEAGDAAAVASPGVIVGGTYGRVGWGGSVVAGGVWVYFLAVSFLRAAQ